MKTLWALTFATCAMMITACTPEKDGSSATNQVAQEQRLGPGQAGVTDNESQKDILHVALGSPNHTTLVAAVQAAELENSLANAGPFTVFAPTNEAFAKLPKGTVEDLVKPENKDKLTDILYHHLAISVFEESSLTDGQDLVMLDGGAAKITKKNNEWFINGAKVVGTVRASNGIVHVTDGVVLPK